MSTTPTRSFSASVYSSVLPSGVAATISATPPPGTFMLATAVKEVVSAAAAPAAETAATDSDAANVAAAHRLRLIRAFTRVPPVRKWTGAGYDRTP